MSKVSLAGSVIGGAAWCEGPAVARKGLPSTTRSGETKRCVAGAISQGKGLGVWEEAGLGMKPPLTAHVWLGISMRSVAP
jgi:hypothetical protein